MKKIIVAVSISISLYPFMLVAQSILDTDQGGTGTGIDPKAGQLLIGTTGGVYSPAWLTAGTDITIATSSGGITINSTASGAAAATTTINNVSGPTFTFTTSSDTNIGLTIATSTGQLTFTPTWIGTLADGRIASASNWNTAYGWGNHALAGYLTSYTETDPVWTASSTNFANWNIAYTDRLKWDGGSTGLVAATGRTSLELGTMSLANTTDYLATGTAATTYFTISGANASNTAWTSDIYWTGTATNLVAATGRTSLGLGDAAVLASSTWAKVANNLYDLQSTSTARTNLGLVIGADVQAYNVNTALTNSTMTGIWQGTPVAYNYGGTGTSTILALQNLWWGDGSGGLVQVASSTLAGTGVSSLHAFTGALDIWGTTNQLTVMASSTVGLVLSLPQNIHTGASPTFAGISLGNTGLHLADTDDSHDLVIQPLSDFTLQRTLGISTGDSDRTITLSGNPTLNDWFDQSVKQAGSPTFAGLTLTGLTGFLKGTAGVIGTSTIGIVDITDISTNYVSTSSAVSTYVARNNWTTIDNYPSACANGGLVSGLGDTLTCVATSTQFTNLGLGTMAYLPNTGGTSITTLGTIGTAAGNISLWTNNMSYATTGVATLSSLTSIGTIGTGVWQGTPIADAYVANDITLTNITQITNRALSSLTGTLNIASTTLVAGNYLTLTNSTVNLDTEIASSTLSINLLNATTTKEAMFKKQNAYTITKVSCNSKNGTTTFNLLERTEAAPNSAGTAVLSASLVCGVSGTASSSAFANSGIAANAPVVASTTAVSGTSVDTYIYMDYFFND